MAIQFPSKKMGFFPKVIILKNMECNKIPEEANSMQVCVKVLT